MELFSAELIGACTGLLVACGTGGKVLLDKVQRRAERSEARQEAERLKLENLFTSQISELRCELQMQDREISKLRHLNTVYLRHMGNLEGVIRALGETPPPLIMPDMDLA